MNNLDLAEMEKQMGDDFWKELEDFPDYIMSLNGKVVRKDGFEPKVCLHNNYYEVNLNKNGKRTKAGIHNLKGLTFLEDYKEGNDIHHINGIKTDNRIENLKAISKNEHLSHHANNMSTETKWKMSANHADYSGEKHPRAILSDWERMAIVLKMSDLIKNGIGVYKAAKNLAEVYPVKYQTITRLYYKYINNKKKQDNN